MRLLKMPAFTFFTILSLLFSFGCVTDPAVAKKRGLVKDFSIIHGATGCEKLFLILSESDTCTTICESGFHLASVDELAKAKNTTDVNLLAKINGSAGVCIDDIKITARPTNDIDINSDFCSCIDGKSDLISDCAATCAARPASSTPTLYLNTIIGPQVAMNTKLGNLYNWCSVQLDTANTPQCFLSATDGTTTISNIPVEITPGSNSLSANIQSLSLDKTYLIKIIEGKSGSNAQSKEFQLRRKTQPSDESTQLGALKVTPISQYTCMSYGGVSNAVGDIYRTTYARIFYYFAANETPPPIPPAGGSGQSQVVCHDEQLHPGSDNAEYPRLELIPQALAMWDKADTRFVNLDGTGFIINKTLTTRLFSEYGVRATIDIFKLINYPNRPTSSTSSTVNVPLGLMMVPFSDKYGKTFCPTQTDFNSSDQPLFNLLKDYMDDTEGLYLAEKQAETIVDGTGYKTVYGTMFITETILNAYGFYIENSIKIKANKAAMNTKTIYYYWPTSTTMDPLLAGNRKLFTVRAPNTLMGNIPTGQPTNMTSTDKRIGCVPKTAL